jgi:hypothetical protein
MNREWPWFALALLGAYHGLNPGMGWLFALSLGLQEKSRRAIGWALLPIAAGHAAAISLTILVVRIFQAALSLRGLRVLVAATLFAMGLYRIFRARHPSGGGMRVGFRDLVLWSFLMALGHGAGLMLAPILLARPMLGMNHDMFGHNIAGTASGIEAIGVRTLGLAVLVHTLSMLLVAGTLALMVYRSYETIGLRLLRHAWLNFDLLWAIALLVAATATLLT